jgi:hypothetical protein
VAAQTLQPPRGPLAEVASGDLYIAVVGQLAATQLALGDPLEPCPL